MSPDLARAVHLAILAAGVVVWLFALRAHRRAFVRPLGHDDAELAAGEVEVSATLPDVREKLVSGLRGAGLAGVGPVRILSAADDRIEGELQQAALGKGRVRPGIAFAITLSPSGSRTSAAYRLTGPGNRGLKLASTLFACMLAPAALAGLAIVMHRFVIPHENPAVRWQVVQTAQAVHFLWPPFLFASVSRRITRVTEEALRTLLSNTAF